MNETDSKFYCRIDASMVIVHTLRSGTERESVYGLHRCKSEPNLWKIIRKTGLRTKTIRKLKFVS